MQKVSSTILKNSGVLWNVSKNVHRKVTRRGDEVLQSKKLWLLLHLTKNGEPFLKKTRSSHDSRGEDFAGWQDFSEVDCFFKLWEHWLVCATSARTIKGFQSHCLSLQSRRNENWHLYWNCGLLTSTPPPRKNKKCTVLKLLANS